MTSEIFDYIGLTGIDPAIILIILAALILILFILVIVQFTKISKLKKSYQKFMKGKNVRSMEEEITSLFNDIDFLKNASEKNGADIKKITKNLTFAYQKVGIVRYDAFREMGGMLSFSIALLNDVNDGFILNSVHSSDGCYTYTKEIVAGESYITLGEEERDALNKAKNCNVEAMTKTADKISAKSESESNTLDDLGLEEMK